MPAPQPSSCLFLPELPADLTDTVLERHFRGFVGFSSSRTRHDRNGKLVGFVEFENVDDASRCRDSMLGTPPFPGLNWHIHFSNNPNQKSGPPAAAPAQKRAREEEPLARAPVQRTSSYGAPPGPEYDHRGMPAHSPQGPPSHSPYAMGPPPGQHPGQHPGYGGPAHPPPHHVGHHAPPEMQDPRAFQPQQPNYLAMQLPPEASSTLYVEGLPADATEREVAHVFRRFEGQGYQGLRISARESAKTPGNKLLLCFIEFDNAHQATVAMYQMQGYKFEKTSTDHGLKIVYAKTRTARSGPPAGGGAPRPALAAPPPRLADRREPERYESRGGGYDDGRDSYQRDPYESHGGGNRRFDGREHSDRYHDDYEDSERGDDDFFQRDANSMEGLTD